VHPTPVSARTPLQPIMCCMLRRNNIDYVSVPNVSGPNDVQEVREALDSMKGTRIKVGQYHRYGSTAISPVGDAAVLADVWTQSFSGGHAHHGRAPRKGHCGRIGIVLLTYGQVVSTLTQLWCIYWAD
jgi:hypothetical protein